MAELLIIALALSLDAFAVSVCEGLQMPSFSLKKALFIALLCASFQAAMPLLGYLLGKTAYSFIEPVDHWCIFIILSILGLRLFFSTENESCTITDTSLSTFAYCRRIILLAFATSLDACAIGIALLFMDYSIFEAIAVIGVVCALLSFAGVFLGASSKRYLCAKAHKIGGFVLIALGIKILLEHLGFLAW